MIGEKTRRKRTYADYLKTPEDKRYELLDGALLMTPAPDELHQRTQAELGYHIMAFVKANGLGRVYYAPTDVALSDVDVVQPDLLFVSNERLRIIAPAGMQSAPDLVVEILSLATAARDKGYKRALYARHGVKEYWIVDTDVGAITVLHLGDDGYEMVGAFGAGESLRSPTLAGFSARVDDRFGS